MLAVIWTLSPDCFITLSLQRRWQAIMGGGAELCMQPQRHWVALPPFPICFSETPGDPGLLGTPEITIVSQSQCPFGGHSDIYPFHLYPQYPWWTPRGSLWITRKPLHYSAQYVSEGCLQIRGFSCQMYSLFPRLSCYNEMKSKQDILISYSARKWDFFLPLS